GDLEVVEERLGVLDRLARKHGGTIAAVLAHAQRSRERRDELASADSALQEKTAALEAAREELAEHAEALRKARRAAATRLARAAERQVLCITHLPQIASLAARHFSICKDTSVEPARTTVTQLAEGDVVGEIVRMLGADAQDVAARRHARELLRAA